MPGITGYEIGSATEFSVETINAIESELRALTDESALLKAEIEKIRDERRAVNARMEPWFAERQRLYRMRGIIPGDVVVGGAE